jgi:transketolase
LKKQATREAYGKALLELGKKHQDIVVLDADLSKSTKTAEFARAFPERFINAGIAEQNLMGMSAGLAAAGKSVFASTFAVFVDLFFQFFFYQVDRTIHIVVYLNLTFHQPLTTVL